MEHNHCQFGTFGDLEYDQVSCRPDDVLFLWIFGLNPFDVSGDWSKQNSNKSNNFDDESL